MAKNFFISAAALMLAIQFQWIEPTSVNDLESLKKDANQLISKDHTEFLGAYREMDDYSQNSYTWIVQNIFMNKIKNLAENSVKDINTLAAKLVENGKNDGKPEEYFVCVELHRNSATAEIEMEPHSYESVMLPFREKAMNDIEYGRNCMEKLLRAVEGLKSTFHQKIDSCEDPACIDRTIREASDAYSHSRSLVTAVWHGSVRAFLKFKNIASVNMLEPEKTIGKLLKNATDKMSGC